MRMGGIAVLVAMLVCGGVFGQGEPPALDIDGNGAVDALTDGLLVLRYGFGFRGAALTTGAVATGCTRCDAEAVEEYLDQFVGEFDIDGNGAVDALTDGLLILRYLFGFRGAALTTGVVAIDCTRCDAEAIDGRLEDLAIFPAQAGDLYDTDSIVGNLRYVPAGTFTQGSPADEPCRETWYPPGSERQFAHTLTRNLAVMETAVTRQMWVDLRAAQPTLPADPTNMAYSSGMNQPVQNMSWYEAVLFANLLSAQRGLTPAYYADAALTQPLTAANYVTDSVYVNWDAGGYRLPTEGEWEYFARAGTTGPFSVNEPNYDSDNCSTCVAGFMPQLESAAWFCANRNDPLGNETSKPVGLKASNPWGLKDVHGGVWEWVWDWYSDPYPGADRTDYLGPASGSFRVYRGGAWDIDARFLRSAARGSLPPYNGGYNIGIRLVRLVN